MQQPARISNRSITRKIIVAFLLAAATIVLSIVISNTSFRKVQGRVEELAAPNPRLLLVNQLFRNIVELDQLQRDQTLGRGAQHYDRFARASVQVQGMLDSLKQMSREDGTAIQRVDSIKQLLYRHDRMLLEYLKLNSNLERMDTLREQVRTLTTLIEKAGDSARVSTENRIVTTIEQIPDSSQFHQERQSLWDRIFSRKKAPEVQKAQRLIRQYYDVKVDTMDVGQADSNMHKLSTAIANAEQNRLSRRNMLLRQQEQLAGAGDALIGSTLDILRELEQKELLRARISSNSAREIISKSIFNINLVLIIFMIGTAILLYIILADVARSNAYRQQLLEAKEEAEQLGSVKQRFLANMSHELRTPLQIIIGTTEQLQASGQLRQDKLNILQQTSQHLLQIVNEVLDYSRIVSGRFRIESLPFDIKAVLEEVHSVIEAQAAYKGLEFRFKAEIQSGPLMGDAFRLKQVLYNLLGNAVKFTRQGYVELIVQQKDFARHSVFTFIISDTGPGIPETELGSIFEQFEQGGQAGIAAKGSGLGLNITRLLLEEQQGTITVDSEWGKGTSFEVKIPYTHAEETATEDAAAIPVYDPAAEVWVVDDDAFIRGLCGELLDKHRVSNRLFGSAEALLEALPGGNPDMLLLDIRLPGMDGASLCRLLRNEYREPLRIVALTAQAMPDERESLMQAGFDLLLNKPFLEKDLLAALGAAMPETPGRTAEQPDLEKLRKMLGDSDALLQQVLRQLIAETREDIGQASDFVPQQQYNEAAERMHRVAGRLGQAGALSVAQQCRQTELQLQRGDASGFAAAREQVHVVLQQLTLTADTISPT